ncbi:MAG: carbon-nitrogen hydrolase family protein [Anaerolineae bacterium]
MRELNVAVVQMEPALTKMEDNVGKMADTIARVATEQPVDIIVFPELSVTGYEGGARFAQMAQRVPGAVTNILGQHATEFGVYVLIGMAIKEDVETVLYNGAVLIAPDGEVAGDYRKVHLPAEERLVFRPGYRIRPIETEIGMLGIMTGWDLTFPEVARSLMLEGAEIILLPAAWQMKEVDMWRTLLVARAYENDIFIAAANRVGEEPSYTFAGQSAVLAPSGEVLAALEEPEEGYVVVRLDLDEVRHRREESQIMLARQPGSYRPVVRKY